jgi:DNA-directed RNA polymerase subunit RPC12/RpoP
MVGPVAQASYQVDCPHCGKTFHGELLVGSSPRAARGFKCPHCRLFVPYERAGRQRSDDHAS